MARTIAVLGSTGSQGGAVALACLKAAWNISGLTRNANGKGAKALAAGGVEMISADVDDLDSLIKAFEVRPRLIRWFWRSWKDVQAVFCLTDFCGHLFNGVSAKEAGEKEAKQAFSVAVAALKTNSLEQYLFSALPSASGLTNGKRPPPPSVDILIQTELPDLAAKTTFVWMGWYSANIAGFQLICPIEVPQSGGKYVWLQPCKPDALLPISGEVGNNLGVLAAAALDHPEKTRGKYVDVRSDLLTFTEVLKVWSEVTGREAAYVNVPPEAFNRIRGPAGEEMSMQYQSDELWGDWERLKGDLVVQPGEIGIEKGQLVDLRGGLMKLKERLL